MEPGPGRLLVPGSAPLAVTASCRCTIISHIWAMGVAWCTGGWWPSPSHCPSFQAHEPGSCLADQVPSPRDGG